ncbi:hypothetical protein [Mycobacterium spongiae]|uniref:Uncharacterized protein n=1 Tax=Mycobacterium spongiae TaxID=886343 RepID=A0A975JXS7_9MYCO|nr:hypothetical protein [Mycobacterium spongiae]QUR67054.1 hypothetical protein F6B93_08035 [Mycobacterium spongiae]
MLSAVAIVPSAPVLVPELSGAAAEVADLRTAVIAAAAALPLRWIAVGTDCARGSVDYTVGPDSVGTFAGFGADVPVRLSPQTGAQTSQRAAPWPELPICALVTGWLRGRARPEASATVQVFANDHGRDTAIARGRQLRTEIDRARAPVGVLITADGANTLTPAAPGGYDPSAAAPQRSLDEALARGDVAALAGLSDRILGRVAFQVLAGLIETGPRSAKELYRGAPYGVGYFAGVWQP